MIPFWPNWRRLRRRLWQISSKNGAIYSIVSRRPIIGAFSKAGWLTGFRAGLWGAVRRDDRAFGGNCGRTEGKRGRQRSSSLIDPLPAHGSFASGKASSTA